MASVDELLRTAIGLHRAGQLREATDYYRQVLAASPRHADAWHLLGVALHQAGQQAAAIEHIKRAIEIDPRHASFYNSLGEAHRASGQLAEARAAYLQALQSDRSFAAAHHNLGLTGQAAGDTASAVAHFAEAVRLQADNAESQNSLGNALRAQGRLTEAVEAFKAALRCRPEFAEALNNLGVTLVNLKRADEGLTYLRRSLALAPQTADTYGNLGYAYASCGQTSQAVAAYQEALRLRAGFVEVRLALAVLLHDLGQMDDAAACFDEVLRMRPHLPQPRHAVAQIYQHQGLAAAAVASYQQAIADQSDFAAAHHQLGTVWLSQGRFAEGWRECEWRWRVKLEPRDFGKPRWDGSPLDGRTVLVHPEQGLGDVLQFVRYVPMLQQAGSRVIIEVHAPLVPLLRSSLAATVVAFGSPLPDFDVHVPLMSLPEIFGTRLESIPADVPYLAVEPEVVELWRKRLEPIAGFRVGIHWQGNPGYTYDRARSIPLVEFAQLAELPGVALVSLQRKDGLEQLDVAQRQFTIHELGDDADRDRGALVDTAAAMQNLDLVITSDTAAAHLAGGLGVPVWLALCFAPDWRWLRDRDDSPWYPTMRLFRQTHWKEWSSVFARIARQLVGEVARRAQPPPKT